MNKIEEFKQATNGLDILPEILNFGNKEPSSITDREKALMKWYGVFFRKHTPGFFMMRIRITNGIATAEQVHALADITKKLGAGFADITTRQQIQLRSVQIHDIPSIFKQLQSVGLTSLQTGMDNVRNIIGCPVAGLTSHELLDASSVARELTDLVVNNRDYSNLPRKFNVTITGCLENCIHAESQDIAMIPAQKNGRDGFNILVGGKMGSGGYRRADSLDVFAEPKDAPHVAAAIIRTFRDNGLREARSQSRFAFLVDSWGIERLRSYVEKEIGERLEHAGTDARGTTHVDHVGIFKQKNGKNYAGLVVPGGRITATQLFDLARIAKTYGNSEIRFTIDQNVIIPNISDLSLRNFQGEPILEVFPYNPPEVLRGLVVCTGIDFCDLALIDTKARAIPLTRSLASKLANRKKPIRIYWSGCPAGCGNHQLADIGFEGTRVRVRDSTGKDKIIEAVDVWVGGRSGPNARSGQRIMEKVPIDDLPAVLEYLVRFFPEKID
jgi:ferredoxin-nitrite reductase